MEILKYIQQLQKDKDDQFLCVKDSVNNLALKISRLINLSSSKLSSLEEISRAITESTGIPEEFFQFSSIPMQYSHGKRPNLERRNKV